MAEELAALREEMAALRLQMTSLVQRLDAVDTAFPRDDLGRPGYELHRMRHAIQEKAHQRLEGYKEGGARHLITLALTALAALVVAGLGVWASKGGG